MLDLSFNYFNGVVPIEVGLLQNLEKMILNGNNLGSGKNGDLDFITSLNNCSKLQVLSMAHSHFGGTLPRSISNFSKTVTELYLGANQISGTIPSAISNLNNLVVLGLQVNLMTGKIPESIGTLKKLQILSLAGNRFSGQIPHSIGNISDLYTLDLSNNRLEGNISSLEKFKSLQKFNLSYNNLNGTIPRQLLLGLSGELTTILLAHNFLIGPLPSEVGILKNLQILDISENKLSGEIPSQLGSCISLEKLHLQRNSFRGLIPSSIVSLKILQQLDLSKNNLSGEIPEELLKLSLTSLNLSFNDFEGEVPTRGIFQNASAFSVDGNIKLCGGIPKLHLRKCHIQKSRKQGVSLAIKLTLGLGIPLLLIVSLFLVLYWTKKHRGSRRVLESERFSGTRLRTISYHDLRKSTDGFSSENMIGMGSFGSVYKGVLRQGEKPIAVKVIDLAQRRASKSFMTECEVLRNVRHRNLLKIITVCSSTDTRGNDFKALVFEFMPNGSVENWLHPSPDREDLSGSLNLLQRINIAIDAASALDYLHNQCETPIVHCDLKPSNILLDDDMVAYVADFGLAKFLPRATSTIRTSDPTSGSAAIVGTVGYIPPEYGTGADVSTQGDVYSYGVFLLEMFTGKRPTDEQFMDGLSLHQFCKQALTDDVMDIIDPHLPFEEHLGRMEKISDCLISIIHIGVACSTELRVDRPGIYDVLVEMHKTKEALLAIEVHSTR